MIKGKAKVELPKTTDAEALTLEEVKDILEKSGKTKKKTTKKKAPAKESSKKTAAKKTTEKKTAKKK